MKRLNLLPLKWKANLQRKQLCGSQCVQLKCLDAKREPQKLPD